MDRQEYLNHIAANSGRPTPDAAPKSLLDKLLTPKALGIALLSLVLFIALMILVVALGSGANKATDLTGQLSLRLDNIKSTIDTYSPKIKNPELRAISTSLSTALTDTSRDLTALLPDLKITNADLTESAYALQESEHLTNLTTVLDNAALNGILDRIYANNITYETSLLVSLELDILSRIKNPELADLLTSSSADLTALHSRLSDFTNKSN